MRWKSILLSFSTSGQYSSLADIMTRWHFSEEFHLSNEPWKPINLKIQPCCHLIPHSELSLKPSSVKTIKLPPSSRSSIIYSCIFQVSIWCSTRSIWRRITITFPSSRTAISKIPLLGSLAQCCPPVWKQASLGISVWSFALYRTFPWAMRALI